MGGLFIVFGFVAGAALLFGVVGAACARRRASTTQTQVVEAVEDLGDPRIDALQARSVLRGLEMSAGRIPEPWRHWERRKMS